MWLIGSTLAQGKRAGPITLRSVDRNYEVLFLLSFSNHRFPLSVIIVILLSVIIVIQ